MTIEEQILAELRTIEEELGVRVLLAVEAGSRARGLASADSDYDVRFVYARRVSDYLALERLNGSVDDTIEWKLEGEYDMSGWDLTKFLALIRKSNPSAHEWLSSPVVYREDPAFAAVRALAPRCFSQTASVFHDLSRADHNLKYLEKGDCVQLKIYLNLVQALLAARWALDRATPAPASYASLIDAELEPEMRDIVEDVVRRKIERVDKDQPDRIPALDEWALAAREDVARRAKLATATDSLPWEELDRVFLDVIGM